MGEEESVFDSGVDERFIKKEPEGAPCSSRSSFQSGISIGDFVDVLEDEHFVKVLVP